MTPSSGGTTLVVGGGVFGLAGALELGLRGWRVTLLDRGPLPNPDASSSDVSKVIRMDYGADVFLTELAARAIDGWRRWNREWPDPPFHEDGFLLLEADALVAGTFEGDSLALLAARGVGLESLDRAGIASRFPAWNTDRFPHGYFNPSAGWAERASVVARLIHEAREAGVTLMPGTSMQSLVGGGGRVNGLRTDDGRTLPAQHVLVAAGAWTPDLVPELRGRLEAVGQPVLYFRPHDPERFTADRFPVWGADISRTGWYGFPALPDGTVKVGHHGTGDVSTPGTNRQAPREIVLRCRAFLEEAVPHLAPAPLRRSRVCYYCDSFDGYFWIDRHPRLDGLTVAAGGSGHGFKFAPLLGGLIADAVEGRPNPDREGFRWRESSRRNREDARYVPGR